MGTDGVQPRRANHGHSVWSWVAQQYLHQGPVTLHLEELAYGIFIVLTAFVQDSKIVCKSCVLNISLS